VPRDSRSEVRLAADLTVEPDPSPSRAVGDDVFRIAIFGDFGARAKRVEASSQPPLARRRAWRVDRDDLDAALAAIAPELNLSIQPDEPPVTVTFRSLDDFHPDRLAEHLPLFQRLRSLRSQPPSVPAPDTSARDAAEPQTLAREMSGGSLLDRILDAGSSESAQASSSRGPRDELGALIDRAVRPYTMAEAGAEQRELARRVDDVIVATMRVLLHHPRFQALESLWRGVDFLVRRLETSASMHVALFDVSREEIAADLGDSAVERSSLYRLLSGEATGASGGAGWSLLVGAYTFGPDDTDLMAHVASLGRAVGAPWLAAGDPRLAGTPSFAADPDPDEWTLPIPADWNALRASPDASYLGLALPRFLLRLPYGAETDECDTFAFEEFADSAPEHHAYLWGNPALLCALAIGNAVVDGEPVPSHATVERMPLHIARVDGEPTAIPVAEALLSHRAVAHLADRGFTALTSQRDDDSVLVPRLQSLAMPPRPLSISRGLPS